LMLIDDLILCSLQGFSPLPLFGSVPKTQYQHPNSIPSEVVKFPGGEYICRLTRRSTIVRCLWLYLQYTQPLSELQTVAANIFAGSLGYRPSFDASDYIYNTHSLFLSFRQWLGFFEMISSST